jgi:hypothetical protein
MRFHLLALSLAVAGCFNPDEPDCAFVCGPQGKCPESYECRPDNYCHKVGTSGPCVGYTDASVPDIGVPDLSMPDMTMMDDGGTPDLFGADGNPACNINGIKDGLEGGIDCGAVCSVGGGSLCALGTACTVHVDCVSSNCVSNVCRPFSAVAPCPTAASYMSNAQNKVTFASFDYTPKCLVVHRGTGDGGTDAQVTFETGETFNFHPLTPSTRGSMPNPITLTSTGTSASFMFPNDGFYAYFCGNHGTADDGSAMAGVIQVVP